MIPAIYFDGLRSCRHPVAVTLRAGCIVIEGGTIHRHYCLADVDVGEAIDVASITLRFRDGSSCEVQDGRTLEVMIGQAGRPVPLIVKLQRHAVWALLALALLGALIFSGYRWGLPWIAEKAAPKLPHATARRLGDFVLRALDRNFLKPSKLPPERQLALRAQIQALATAVPLPAYHLQFRSAPGLGANAFALPGGVIVVLDRLVTVADNEQLTAVVAHELGHVAHHHAVRRLIQDAVVSTAVAAYMGDLSSAAASATALALEASYSRQFELQADLYAAERLSQAGRDPLALAALLEKIERPASRTSMLSSHPDTYERVVALRQFAAATTLDITAAKSP